MQTSWGHACLRYPERLRLYLPGRPARSSLTGTRPLGPLSPFFDRKCDLVSDHMHLQASVLGYS